MQETNMLPEVSDETGNNPTGKGLDPLLNPPDQMSIVQALKGKIDSFAHKVATYKGSKKQLQQVLVALAMHPFTESAPEFGYTEAQDVYNLGVEIVTDKLLFLHVGIKEQELAKSIREKTEKEALLQKTLDQTEGLDDGPNGMKEAEERKLKGEENGTKEV